MNRYRAVALSGMLGILGCTTQNPILNHTPGTTYGRIALSSPKVTTRESLVNDRLNESKWLRDYLGKTDTEEFGIQGRSLIRSFQGVAGGLALEAGPQVQAVNAAQSNLTNFLKGQANVQQQQLDVASTQLAIQQQSLSNLQGWLNKSENKNFVLDPTTGKLIDLSKGESGTQVTQTGSPPTPSAAAPAFPNTPSQFTTFKQQAELLPEPTKFPGPPSVQVTPIDRFRDRLALRQEIRNEILDNQLDDRHDLAGYTLYRLKFDAHVIPEDDTSAFAVIELEVKEDPKRYSNGCRFSGGGDLDCTGLASLYKHWVVALQDVSNQKLRDVAKREAKGEDIELLDPALAYEIGVARAGLAKGDDKANKELAPLSLDQALLRFNQRAPNASPLSWDPKRCVLFGSDERQCFEARAIQVAIATQLSRKFEELICIRLEGSQPAMVLEAADDKVMNCFSHNTNFSYKDLYEVRDQRTAHVLGLVAARLNDNRDNNSVYVYEATPKESTERVSEMSSARDALNLAFLMQAAAGQILGKSFLEVAQEREGMFESLRRQPIVVGFSADKRQSLFADGPLCSAKAGHFVRHSNSTTCDPAEQGKPENEQTRFGWLIGPRFKIRNDGRQAHFRQVAVQHGVAVQIAVPAWWRKVEFSVKTGWILEDGTVAGVQKNGDHITVPLPLDIEALNVAVLEREDPRARHPEHVASSLIWGVDTFEVGKPASIIIQGVNLHRSAEVSLGSQVTQDVRVLPGMRGVVATFSPVADPGGLYAPTDRKAVKVHIWTNAGSVLVGSATIRPPRKEEDGAVVPSQTAVAFGPQVLVQYGSAYKLDVIKGKLPSHLVASPVRIRSSDDTWLPLQGGAVESKDNKTWISYTMKLVGQESAQQEDSRRGDLTGQPLEIGLFIDDKIKPLVSSARPILLAQAQSVSPICVLSPGNGNRERNVTVKFDVPPLIGHGDKFDFPSGAVHLIGNKLVSAGVCEKAGRLLCTAKIVMTSGNENDKVVTLSLRNDKGEDLGFKDTTCQVGQ